MAQSQLLQEALVKTLGVIRKYRAHLKRMQIHLCSVILQSSHQNCLICIPEVRYVLDGCYNILARMLLTYKSRL